MYTFAQKQNFHHSEGGLWILCCASNTPCVLYYTQPQIPTLIFPWDRSQLTHCSGSNQDAFPFWWFVLLGCNTWESQCLLLCSETGPMLTALVRAVLLN